MNVWAIVPVKPLNRAKSRLAAALSAEVREHLAIRMLQQTVSVLTESGTVSGVLVISRDNRALVVARKYGVKTVQESGAPELNAALERASQVITSWYAQAALILPADLPLLAVSDLNAIVELGRYQQSAVIAPDRMREGTNALLMRPPGLFEYAFGPGSFEKHCQAAETAGATVHVYRSERLMLDLDTPDDLLVYLEMCQKSGIEPLVDLQPEDLLPFSDMPQKERP